MLSVTAAGRRVLLVDDDFLMREAVSLVLAGEGYMVAAAANGRDALERLQGREPPDLILLDLQMPVMDGTQFREELTHNARLAGVPVLVISASGDARRLADALGAVGCLQKPVDTGQLLDAVRRCCGAPRGGGTT
jgi:CheY-like chemotaxis protein